MWRGRHLNGAGACLAALIVDLGRDAELFHHAQGHDDIGFAGDRAEEAEGDGVVGRGAASRMAEMYCELLASANWQPPPGRPRALMRMGRIAGLQFVGDVGAEDLELLDELIDGAFAHAVGRRRGCIVLRRGEHGGEEAEGGAGVAAGEGEAGREGGNFSAVAGDV